MKTNTDPKPIFHQIQNNITHLTGQNIYWDSAIQNSITTISIDQLLKKELTEDLIIQIVLLNNKNLQAIYETLGIAKANFAQAGLLKNPIFSFSYLFATKSLSKDLIDIGLFQNFLEILLIPLKKRVAQAELEIAKTMITAQLLDIIAETKIAIYQLQATKQIWELKKQVLLASELSYEAAQKLFEAGNIKDLQVSMKHSVYESIKLEVASWEVAVLEAREKLNILMGLWGQQIDWEIFTELPPIPDTEENFDNIEKIAISNSLDLKRSYNELLSIAAQYGIDTTKLVFPQFNIGISSEKEEGVWHLGPGFNLGIPIFDWGKVNSAKAKAKIMQKWNQYTALAIEIRSKSRFFRFSLHNTFRQSKYLKKIIVPLAEKITHSTILQNNAMQLGIFDLLLTKQAELDKKIESIQMQLKYLKSKIMLQTLLNGHIVGKNMSENSIWRNYE
jgi:cobalt-zinc-cadmium efflux system outer membrane protein